MAPVILTLLQGLFLLLLYVFVARAVRAVLRDVSASGAARVAPRRVAKPRRPAGPAPRRDTPRRVVVHFPEGDPRTIPLNTAPVTLGRSPDCTVALDDPYVSDHHARIYRDSDGWMVTDDGSTNGTYLNQQKVTGASSIAAGDQISVGKTVVEVQK